LHRVIHSLLCGYSVQPDRLFPRRYGQKSCDVGIRQIERVTVGKADRFFRQSFSDQQSAPPFASAVTAGVRTRVSSPPRQSQPDREGTLINLGGHVGVNADVLRDLPVYPVPHPTKCCSISLRRQLQNREGDKFLPGPAFFISGTDILELLFELPDFLRAFRGRRDVIDRLIDRWPPCRLEDPVCAA